MGHSKEVLTRGWAPIVPDAITAAHAQQRIAGWCAILAPVPRSSVSVDDPTAEHFPLTKEVLPPRSALQACGRSRVDRFRVALPQDFVIACRTARDIMIVTLCGALCIKLVLFLGLHLGGA